MQSINVFENGIRYLSECLNLYLGGCGYLLLYLTCVIYIFLKGNDEEKELFIPPTIVLVVTIYNPVVPLIVDKVFDISSEYYRFFWIVPIIILVPFVIGKLICDAATRQEKITISILITIVMILSGRFVYETGIPFAQNMYKIPDELIEISQIIHEDSGNEYAKAFFEYEYNMEIRQYDPKMLLTIDREEYIYAVNYSYTEDMINDDAVPTNRILACLIRNQDVEPEQFCASLESTGTEYIVLTKGNPKIQYIENAGLSYVADTATHCIYKYNAIEPRVYELIDYSGVEHKFSFRRLK